MKPQHSLRVLVSGLLASVLLAGADALPAAEQQPIKLVGAGATFPAPLYLRWTNSYHREHPNVFPDYQAIGSGGGVKDLIGGRVDFAGTDIQMTDEEVAQVDGGVLQLPMAIGAIVLVYNLDGVDPLKLSRDAVTGIFSGRIERWNDPIIAAANPDAALPDRPITVVTRVGASGTSYTLTEHLGITSRAFAEAVVSSLSPTWPQALQQRGGLVKAGGNDGVAATVRAIPGSIGYVQYAFAYLTSMKMAMLENQSGQMVAPNEASFTAAIAAITERPGVEALRDPPGDESYPIIGISWLVLRRHYDDPAKLPALIDLMEYALGPGQQDVAALGYMPYSAEGIAYVQDLLDGLKQYDETNASSRGVAPSHDR
ncbi:MAG: phosphate ABC transporter substrate-binding protein PstS [Thiohalocapsa sp.]